MSKIKCFYLGDLKCEAKHLQSGNNIKTDAPLDHCGKGENFSPTDLLATSLGTCLLPSFVFWWAHYCIHWSLLLYSELCLGVWLNNLMKKSIILGF